MDDLRAEEANIHLEKTHATSVWLMEVGWIGNYRIDLIFPVGWLIYVRICDVA